MHHQANDDAYEVREVRRTGPGTYVVRFDVRGSVAFIAMPLSVRLVGDATIIAVGREMGWHTKPGPVWATRLSMSCGRLLPLDGSVECRVALSPLAPSLQPGTARVATAHYWLGDGEVFGVAGVSIPQTDPEAGGATTAPVHASASDCT